MNTTAQDVERYLRSTYGDRAADTYRKICLSPFSKTALERDFSDSEQLLTRLCDRQWWTTKEICLEMGWNHTKTSQTVQYLIREGKVVSRQVGGKVLYRKSTESELENGLQLELKGVA
jgi:hypothetical protein